MQACQRQSHSENSLEMELECVSAWSKLTVQERIKCCETSSKYWLQSARTSRPFCGPHLPSSLCFLRNDCERRSVGSSQNQSAKLGGYRRLLWRFETGNITLPVQSGVSVIVAYDTGLQALPIR